MKSEKKSEKKIKKAEKEENRKLKKLKEGKKKKKKAIKDFLADETFLSLKEENEELKKQLKNHERQSLIKDEMVFQQSRFAIMGEMIGNIAHQYRQPLMELSTLLMKEEAKIKLLEKVDMNDILNMISSSNDILKYMSTTIDDFRDFFAQNKKKRGVFCCKADLGCFEYDERDLEKIQYQGKGFYKKQYKTKRVCQ